MFFSPRRKVFISYYHGDQEAVNKFVRDFSDVFIPKTVGVKDGDFDFDSTNPQWYEAFKVIRNLLEEIPAERISEAKGLVDLTTNVLNHGLRPHLTKWQARFRAWYSKAVEKSTNLSPQEIQKDYPEYQLLVDDLKKTNDIIDTQDSLSGVLAVIS